VKKRLGGVWDQLHDPLLTVLTVLLLFVLFVIVPLFRFKLASSLHLYLEAGACLTIGLLLIFVVARAIGQLYPATLLARLVTLELQDRRR
jgi:hypothetical protein